MVYGFQGWAYLFYLTCWRTRTYLRVADFWTLGVIAAREGQWEGWNIYILTHKYKALLIRQSVFALINKSLSFFIYLLYVMLIIKLLSDDRFSVDGRHVVIYSRHLASIFNYSVLPNWSIVNGDCWLWFRPS